MKKCGKSTIATQNLTEKKQTIILICNLLEYMYKREWSEMLIKSFLKNSCDSYFFIADMQKILYYRPASLNVNL